MTYFDGATPADVPRLNAQIVRIRTLMSDGLWRSLDEIASETGDPPASISAQLRHLRKPRFGSYTVDKFYVGGGLYRYRLSRQVNPRPRTRPGVHTVQP
jgi:hypothetical protein